MFRDKMERRAHAELNGSTDSVRRLFFSFYLKNKTSKSLNMTEILVALSLKKRDMWLEGRRKITEDASSSHKHKRVSQSHNNFILRTMKIAYFQGDVFRP